MLKIGGFSRLSMPTVKALRFYEKEGLLAPARVDGWLTEIQLPVE